MSKLALQRIRENLEKHERGEDARRLDLGRCGMTEVPREIGYLVWLEELILSEEWWEYDSGKKRRDLNISENKGEKNKLKNLPPKLSLLIQLKKVITNHSAVSDLSPLSALVNLQQFDCSYTQVLDLSPLSGLANLQQLDCSSMRISDLGSLSGLANLQQLSCDSTQVSDLSPLSALVNLHRLYCRKTKIIDLSPLSALTNLQQLYCDTTRISDLSPLSGLANLQQLNCDTTRISDLSPLSGLANLQQLNCSLTQINDLSPLSQLTNLQQLSCSSTKVSDLGPLSQLTNLLQLSCSSTKVRDLSPLSALTNLQKLDYSYTQVSDLSPLLPLIKKGRRVSWGYSGDIRVMGCLLTQPPVEVVQMGNEAILEYFDRIEKEGAKELLEAKAILIGEGMAGKTSLRNRLLGRPLPTKADRTKGLDVEVEPYRFPLADGKEMQLNLFDFGGQDHYKPLHQFFYSKRSLYLLLTKNGDDQNDFDFWLDTAKLHGDDSPLLVVNNLFGEVKCNFNPKQWTSQYPFLKASYEVNLENLNGLEDLKQKIEAYAQTLPHIRQPVPKSWAAIRESLREQKAIENFIHLNQYLSICRAHGIDERDSAMHLSRYLHDIGVFLHFQDNETLRKWVILRNEWATEAVYRVLDDSEIIAQKGHFAPPDLKRVWCADEYEDMRDALLELMKEFRLCYPKPDGQRFIAPSLLPTEPPDYVWEVDADERRIHLEYVFMPRVLFTQFVVAEHEKIEDGRLCVWRSGAVFSKAKARVQVRQLGKNTLEFRAQGSGKVELLTILNDTLDELHKQTPGIEVERFIPCICSKCRLSGQPYLFPKSRLDNRLLNNRSEDECQKSFENVDIEDMLGHVLLKKPDHKHGVGTADIEHREKQPYSRTIKIFLASSFELQPERERIELEINRMNKDLRNKGLFIELLIWEDGKHIGTSFRSQDNYNLELDTCDVFFLLFYSKVGKFTKEEFERAKARFDKAKAPRMVLFQKNAALPNSISTADFNSRQKFLDQLKKAEHYPTPFGNIDALIKTIGDCINKLLQDDDFLNTLTES